jgi:hypothetical protein
MRESNEAEPQGRYGQEGYSSVVLQGTWLNSSSRSLWSRKRTEILSCTCEGGQRSTLAGRRTGGIG